MLGNWPVDRPATRSKDISILSIMVLNPSPKGKINLFFACFTASFFNVFK